MLGLELDPLRAEKRALRTGKGVAWPPLRTMKNHQIFTSLRYTQCLTIFPIFLRVASVSTIPNRD